MNDFGFLQLEAAMKRRMQAMPKRLRPFSLCLKDLPRALVLTGQRGVGKTTCLLHHARGRRFMYLSADNPLLANAPLYETVYALFMKVYEGVVIDEVHYAQDWSLHAKALYDDFPDRSLWLSDSSALILRSGVADLSRRFVSISMPLLSFREFLCLKTDQEWPVFDPFSDVPLAGSAEILAWFREYRQSGTRPFFADGNFAERMMGVMEKTMQADVPFFLPHITDGNLRLMNAIIGTLAQSTIPRLQVRSLCADWHIGAEKLYQLVFVMESMGMLRVIRKAQDTKANTVGEKLFFGDPVYYDILGGDTGTAREALVASMMIESGHTLTASADETRGDFLLDERLVLEVGGASKRPKQADFVIRDDVDQALGKVIPLWALGFGY